MVSFIAEEIFTPRNSFLDLLNNKRPARRMKKVNGIINEKLTLYPSNDLLGRRDCVEILPILSDSEREFMQERKDLLIQDDGIYVYILLFPFILPYCTCCLFPPHHVSVPPPSLLILIIFIVLFFF